MDTSTVRAALGTKPPEVEVLAKASRRRFTAEYKRKILREADACTAPGALGALLALVLVAVSLVTVLAGVLLAFRGAIAVATLSSITSLLCTTIAALLYKRLDSAQKSVETARREVLKELQKLDSKGA